MNYLKPLMDRNFLEYASYVIKERAIPDLEDGLKPVQRRILHTMWRMDDGKFHKVANIIGETMKLHPHGDASIYGALVVLANKDLFIEKQGNFGNLYTGDPASAARYIEARLTPLGREVLFNPELTEFEESYDGRLQEPIVLPCKIPSVLLLGTDGIAVGMATAILPHNFQEVLQAQIAYLRGEAFELYPDFPTGGLLDVQQYQQGQGKVRVRAKIEVPDEKTLLIREIPFGTTTESLIRSIQEAVNKGKLKLSSINDYTAENVEIELRAPRGISAQTLLKPLYAFTDCELSISVNLLVIHRNQPVQTTVNSILEENTKRLLRLLQKELEIEQSHTREKWHAKRLEAYFIENRLHRLLEPCETYEAMIETIRQALLPFASELKRAVSDEDIESLLSLPFKRLSKFDSKKSEQELKGLEVELKRLERHLQNVTQYAIDYLQHLLDKYGSAYPRRTQIQSFEGITLREVVKSDQKVGWQKDEGYLGTAVKSETIFLCSPYDRLVLFYTDGRYKVIKVPEKLFVGQDVYEIAKVDEETVFNLIYFADANRLCYAKRFKVKGFILDKEYRLFPEKKGAKIASLSTGNGKGVELHYLPAPRLKVLKEPYRFDELAVKGISALGNRVASKPIQKVKTLDKLPPPSPPPQLSLLAPEAELPVEPASLSGNAPETLPPKPPHLEEKHPLSKKE